MGSQTHWPSRRPSPGRTHRPASAVARRLALLWLLLAPWLALAALVLGSAEDRSALFWISSLGWLVFLFYQYLASGLYGESAWHPRWHLIANVGPPLFAFLAVASQGDWRAWREWCLAAGLVEMLGLCGAACLLPWSGRVREQGSANALLGVTLVPLMLGVGVVMTFGQALARASASFHPAWLAAAVTMALLLRCQAWQWQRDPGGLFSGLDAARWLWGTQLAFWILPGLIL